MIRKLNAFFAVTLVLLIILFLQMKRNSQRFDLPTIEFAELPVTSTYSFFVAGHVYGNPSGTNLGLHPPFKKKLGNLRKAGQSVDMGFFTGDIVRLSDPESWQAIRKDIVNLQMPIHMAFGNHDYRAPFLKKGQKKSYYTFSHGDDVFIILDPNLSGWNIKGAQLAFLEKTLQDASVARNIFVFSSQLIWWSPDNEFACISPNSQLWRRKKSNFYTEVLPLFDESTAEIFFFAGDVGIFQQPIYDRNDNIHFIASGMGGGDGTYLEVHVNDQVNIEIKWLSDQSRGNSTDLQTYQIACPAN